MTGSLSDSVTLVIVTALFPILTAVLTWLGVKLGALIQAHVKNQILAGVFQQLDYAVLNAVKSVEQTLLQTARASGAGISGTEALDAKATAIRIAKRYLGPAGRRGLAEVVGLNLMEVDQVLADRIEAAVLDLASERTRSSIRRLPSLLEEDLDPPAPKAPSLPVPGSAEPSRPGRADATKPAEAP